MKKLLAEIHRACAEFSLDFFGGIRIIDRQYDEDAQRTYSHDVNGESIPPSHNFPTRLLPPKQLQAENGENPVIHMYCTSNLGGWMNIMFDVGRRHIPNHRVRIPQGWRTLLHSPVYFHRRENKRGRPADNNRIDPDTGWSYDIVRRGDVAMLTHVDMTQCQSIHSANPHDLACGNITQEEVIACVDYDNYISAMDWQNYLLEGHESSHNDDGSTLHMLEAPNTAIVIPNTPFIEVIEDQSDDDDESYSGSEDECIIEVKDE